MIVPNEKEVHIMAKKIYPDTTTFHYHNQNPRGRITGDCVFRAISLALDKDYNECVMEMATTMCETGYALNDNKGEDAYLKKHGWLKQKQPRKSDNTKYTGVEFCNYLNKYFTGDSVVCHIGGHHMVCIKRHNGKFKIWDIWNSTDGTIGNYWCASTRV